MIEQIKTLKVRRFIAYFLDGIILSGLSSVYISIGLKLGILKFYAMPNVIVPLIVQFIGIMVSIAYYTLCWHSAKRGSTLGQFLCKLKIKKPATIKQCVKRVLLMNIAAVYFWFSASYVFIRKLEGDTQVYCVAIVVLSTILMQLIYAFNIDRVEKITAIEVVAK
jgi:uncharacterized RDD family membrane protein YckC